MTHEEIIKQIGGGEAHISYDEAKMAYDSDKELAEKVDRMRECVEKDRGFLPIVLAAMVVGIPYEKFEQTVFRALVEEMLND